MRQYSLEDVEYLKTQQQVTNENGLEIIFKQAKDATEDYVLDKKVQKELKHSLFLAKFVPSKLLSIMKFDFLKLRKSFNGVKSVKIIEDNKLRIYNLTFDSASYQVPIKIYLPKNNKNNLPVFYYLHGGGFFAGDITVVEESLKLIALNYPCLVAAINYRLAPEHQYPLGHNDCYNGLHWLYKNIKEYGGNPKQIFIGGDSAGGNMALYCVNKDLEEKTKIIKAQILYYPCVNLGDIKNEFTIENDQYQIKKSQAKLVNMIGKMMTSHGNKTMTELLGAKNYNHCYLSPFIGNLDKMPPTLMFIGEYDFLLSDNKAFIRKLQKTKVENKFIIYKGLLHAFFDKAGIYPQTEDSIHELISFAKKYL